MMKNETFKKYLTLTLFVTILLGLVVGASFLFAPIKDKSILKEKLKKYSKITENITSVEEVEFESTIISEKLKGFDNKGNEVATLYTASKSNEYGHIEIIVAVDLEGKIIGIDSTIMDQSIKPTETRNYLKGYKGSLINKLESTIASPSVMVSVGTVDEILAEVSNSHGILLTKFQETYGEEAKRGSLINLEDEVVTGMQEVTLNDENVGVIYIAKNNMLYNDGKTEVIELELYLDKDLNVVGYEFLTYKHTIGFQKIAVKYLELLVESKVNIHEANNKYDENDYTDATNSANATAALVLAISDYIELGLEPVLGEVTEINEGTLVSKQEITINNKVVSTIYILKGDISYVGRGGNPGNGIVEIKIVVDSKTNAITEYEFLEYDNTPNWKKNVDAYLEDLIENEKTIAEIGELEIEFDGSISSTYTVKGIVKMIKDLKVYLEGGE